MMTPFDAVRILGYWPTASQRALIAASQASGTTATWASSARDWGIGRATLYRAAVVYQQAPEYVPLIRQGKLTVGQAYQRLGAHERRAMQNVHDRIKKLDPDGSIYGAWFSRRGDQPESKELSPGSPLRLVR